VGGWGTITGFLRQGDFSAATVAVRLLAFWKREYSRILLATSIGLGVLFLGSVFYLRSAEISGNPQTYLYLEIGGTLISFCYAANALVRFRGTHDRTALILSFGFVLSGIIETVSYFGLNDQLQSGQVPMTSIPMGWMVSRTLLGIMLLAAILIERYIPTARQPSRETAGALLSRTLRISSLAPGICFPPVCSSPLPFIFGSAWLQTALRALPVCMTTRYSQWPR
jgi:TRAP-type C4-dicarboxylate transport system permease small subunit